MKKLILTAFVLLGLVLVSQAQTKHTIGEKFGGGIVFYVDETGEHGQIIETIDQGTCWFPDAKELAKTGTHSVEGKAFTDWYLPTVDDWKMFKNSKIRLSVNNTLPLWSNTVEYGSELIVTIKLPICIFQTEKPHKEPWPSITRVRAMRDF